MKTAPAAPAEYETGISLRGRLVATFSAFVAVGALFTAFFVPALLNRQATREAMQRSGTVAGIISYSLAAPLFFGDDRGVAEVLEGVRKTDDVRFVAVRNAQGGIVAQHGNVVNGGFAGMSPDGNTHVSVVRVMHGSTLVGTLTLGTSFDDLDAAREFATRLGLLFSVLSFVVGVAVVYTLSSLLTRSLTRVVGTVQRISDGDLSLRAAEPQERELAELVKAFNGMVDRFVGAQGDLSRANAELESRVRARTAELQAFIDLAPQAILEVDPQWRVTRWNKAAEGLFGWTAHEVIGRPIPYVPDEEREDFERSRETAIRGEHLPPREVVRQRKDGSLVHVLLAVASLRDASGRPIAFIGVCTDLTERRSLESQLRQSQKMEAVGRLAGGIAHDFNNILTVITACAAMVRDTDTLHPGLRDDVQQILDAATRAAALTRQLLTFSRSQIVTLRKVDVGTVIGGMKPMLRRLLRENIDLQVHLSPSAGWIHADPMQIEQVIMNLVVNASDAMPDGGRLTIEGASAVVDEHGTATHGLRPGAYQTIIVNDTGTGMDEATLARIFEPFFTTKGIGHGTGLGLATTYGIIDQLKGRIDVRSKPRLGTTFIIYIPVLEVASAANESEPRPALPSRSRGAETVLLVEDEQPVRAMLKRTLEREGYRILEADSGEAGLELARTLGSGINIVVTDVMMPGMNGRVFADKLSHLLPVMRVIFMSGYADDAVRTRGLEDETHRFLQKPFTGAKLAAMVRSTLDASRAAA